MTIAIHNTNLMNQILSSIKSDGKGVSQVTIKIIRDTQVCAAGDYIVLKPSK